MSSGSERVPKVVVCCYVDTHPDPLLMLKCVIYNMRKIISYSITKALIVRVNERGEANVRNKCIGHHLFLFGFKNLLGCYSWFNPLGTGPRSGQQIDFLSTSHEFMTNTSSEC